MKGGWFRENYRHSLARRGIQTKKQKDLSGKTVVKSTKAGHDFLPYVMREGLYSGYAPTMHKAGRAVPEVSPKLGEKTADKFFAKKYYAGILDREHEDRMADNIRVRDINQKQEKVLANLTKEVNEGRMTGENRERFMKEEFANEAKLYLDGAISKEDFDETVDRKADNFTKLQSRPHGGMFSFGAATGQE